MKKNILHWIWAALLLAAPGALAQQATPPLAGGCLSNSSAAAAYHPLPQTGEGNWNEEDNGVTYYKWNDPSCSDAVHPNRCDSGNNLMDYCNQGASTPCQLDIVHGQLYNTAGVGNDYRNYLTRATCDQVPPRAFFTSAFPMGNAGWK